MERIDGSPSVPEQRHNDDKVETESCAERTANLKAVQYASAVKVLRRVVGNLVLVHKVAIVRIIAEILSVALLAAAELFLWLA